MKKLFCFTVSLCLGFSAFAQNVTIDMRYNVIQSEPSRDYFNWSIGTKRFNDKLDAVSGASTVHSTREFDAVRYDSMTNRRYTMPRGIRHLLLFPVASRQYNNNFYLTVENVGKKLIIQFILYGTVYQIQTDDNKKIDISNSCFWAENITENNSLVSALRAQYVKQGANPNNMNALDWNKINLVPDIAASNASRKYSGILTTDYNNGVLTVNGVLALRE
ncbi:MAG: hypothetical protein LBT01_07765 [Spirochaetaceae bacterium]|jgi:hypothetical protein|nr:hypothetical protein [Spirochaetaceae bacterium]